MSNNNEILETKLMKLKGELIGWMGFFVGIQIGIMSILFWVLKDSLMH